MKFAKNVVNSIKAHATKEFTSGSQNETHPVGHRLLVLENQILKVTFISKTNCDSTRDMFP